MPAETKPVAARDDGAGPGGGPAVRSGSAPADEGPARGVDADGGPADEGLARGADADGGPVPPAARGTGADDSPDARGGSGPETGAADDPGIAEGTAAGSGSASPPTADPAGTGRPATGSPSTEPSGADPAGPAPTAPTSPATATRTRRPRRTAAFTGGGSGAIATALGIITSLAAVAAVLVVHVLAAFRAGDAAATVGEARLAAAAFGARVGELVDPLPPADLFAARQLAAIQVLLPTEGIAVVDAARWACLAAGLLVAVVLWGIQTSLGLARSAAAAGVLVAGALPPAVAVHAGVTAAAPAALWLAAAALLVVRVQGRTSRTAYLGVVCAVVAVLTSPLLAAAVLALGAHAVLDRSVLNSLSNRARIGLGAVIGVAAVAVAGLAIGSGPLAGVGGPLLGDAGAIGCALLGVVVLGLGWWRARWLRPLLSPAVLLLAIVLFVPGPSRAAAAVLVIPVLALGVGVLVDEIVHRAWVAPVVLLAAVATVVAALPGGVPAGPRADGVERLADWARTELDPAVALRVDPLDRAELVRAGLPADRLLDPGATPGPDDLVVVSDRAGTGGPAGPPCPPDGVLAAVERGAGGVRTEICAADPARSAQLADERAARARLGAELADNPSLTVRPAAATALRAGDVDSRLLVALVALSGDRRLGVEAFLPAMSDADGVPARRVLLSRVDDGPAAAAIPALRSWLDGQQPPFAPSVLAPAGDAVLVGYPAPARPGLLPGG